MTCFAWTPATGPGYPPYLNISVQDDQVVVSMREAPKVCEDRSYICSLGPGPGNCTAGGPNCNNYCNYDPTKPMPDRPKPCTQVFEGKQALIRVPVDDWTGMGLPLPPA